MLCVVLILILSKTQTDTFESVQAGDVKGYVLRKRANDAVSVKALVWMSEYLADKSGVF